MPRIISVSVDQRVCSGCAICYLCHCPDVFDSDGDGLAVVRTEAVKLYDRLAEDILSSEADCPTGAIRVISTRG